MMADVGRRQGARWSDSEVDQLRALASRHTDVSDIALLLGRTEVAVRAKLFDTRSKGAFNEGAAIKSQRRRVSGASFFLS
jgi:hypothetical protein